MRTSGDPRVARPIEENPRSAEMVRILHPSENQNHIDTKPEDEEDLVKRLMNEARELARFARDPRGDEGEVTFRWFEQALIPKVFSIARIAVTLFLTCAEKRVRAQRPTWIAHEGRKFQKTKARRRTMTTWFGKVRYWRTYMLEREVKPGEGHGFYPLDVELGLTSDRFSLGLFSVVVRLVHSLIRKMHKMDEFF